MMTISSPARRVRWVVGAVATIVVVAVVVTWLLTRSNAPGPAAEGDPSSPGTTPSRVNGSRVPSPSPGTSFTPGSGHTEPDHVVRTRKAVPITSGTAHFGTRLSVRVLGITPVTGKATLPGEIGGPALRIRLRIHNASRHPVSLGTTVVAVSYGSARTPAGELSDGESRFGGSVPPRGSRQGTYVFTVPESQRSDVRIEVSYTGRAPTVAFEGTV